MRVVKDVTPPVERKTLVELTDREIAFIYAALLETEYTTESNTERGEELWVQFHELTLELGIEAQSSALYQDAK